MYYGTSIPTEPAKEGPNTPTHIRRQIYHNMTVAATACIGVITTYRGGTGASGGPSRRLAAAPTDLVEVDETEDALDPATQLLKLKREIADQIARDRGVPANEKELVREIAKEQIEDPQKPIPDNMKAKVEKEIATRRTADKITIG